jgi:hypothetical protein
MTFQAFLGLVAACLAGPLLAMRIERYLDDAAAAARAEKERAARALDMRLRLHETEQHLAVTFAEEVNRIYGEHSHLRAEISYDTQAETGLAVSVSLERGEREILTVLFDLKGAHSKFPMILKLGDNEPLGYPNTEMGTVQAMADKANDFIKSVVTPATVH